MLFIHCLQSGVIFVAHELYNANELKYLSEKLGWGRINQLGKKKKVDLKQLAHLGNCNKRVTNPKIIQHMLCNVLPCKEKCYTLKGYLTLFFFHRRWRLAQVVFSKPHLSWSEVYNKRYFDFLESLQKLFCKQSSSHLLQKKANFTMLYEKNQKQLSCWT